MPINYISSSYGLRYSQLYRLQELLRLDHNKNGAAYKSGLMSKKDWEDYLILYFNPASELITAEILKYRELIKKDNTNPTDLTDVIL